jgi:hypothetical protein
MSQLDRASPAFPRFAVASAAVFGLFLLAGCATKAPMPEVQEIVQDVAARHADVTRLTVHAVPASAGQSADYCVVACSLPERLGRKSDPEDLQSMQTGQIVVLDEQGAHDVTIPILQKGGKHTATVGVTVRAGTTRDAAMAQAKVIAAEIETRMAAPPK